MTFSKYFLIFMAMFPLKLFAHGEDKLGPHGGFIRMPGAFHTEVLQKNGNLFVYILDVTWKDPQTENSSVEAFLKKNGKESSLVCSAKKDVFQCTLPRNEKLEAGELIVKGKRGTVPPGVAIYDLPLRLAVVNDGHGNH